MTRHWPYNLPNVEFVPNLTEFLFKWSNSKQQTTWLHDDTNTTPSLHDIAKHIRLFCHDDILHCIMFYFWHFKELSWNNNFQDNRNQKTKKTRRDDWMQEWQWRRYKTSDFLMRPIVLFQAFSKIDSVINQVECEVLKSGGNIKKNKRTKNSKITRKSMKWHFRHILETTSIILSSIFEIRQWH